MKIKAIIHQEEGGYWAEFPTLPGCFTQGDTYDELMHNIREAIDCHLGDDNVNPPAKLPDDVDVKVVEVAI
ncbi:MAG: type II toxin-antitoxin system HicB family antitoxin [bacterium]